MCKFVYKWLVDAKLKSSAYIYHIVRAIEVLEKYNLWTTNKYENFNVADWQGRKLTHRFISDTYFTYFKREDGKKTVYDLFYDNLHIHASVSDKEKIYSIRIKKADEEWACPIEVDGTINTSHPQNDTFEVYVWYSLPILDFTRVEDDEYRHGNWDKYVYLGMNAFVEEIENNTVTAKFNNEYKRYKKNMASE